MSKEESLIEVSWGGKKLHLTEAKLDEWHAAASNADKIDYINDHPEIREPTPVHRIKKERSLQEPEDLVLVHWSGNKTLLLERFELDKWFHGSYEEHVDFVKQHPESQVE